MNRKSGRSQTKNSRGARSAKSAQLTPTVTSNGNGHAPAELLPCIASSELVRREVRWLWPSYVPYAGLALIAGPPGIGKTTFLAALAAQVTGGPRIGGGRRDVAQAALWLTMENDLANEVGGKLAAAGADRERVLHPLCDAEGNPSGRITLPGDAGRLDELIRGRGAAAVFLEPMDSYLAEHFDVNDGGAVRCLLDVLGLVARRTGAAILFTRHWRKDRSGDALSWVMGSAAWAQCPATVLSLSEHPDGDGRGVLRVEKTRLVKKPLALSFTLEDAGAVPRFKLGDKLDAEADELAGRQEARAARDELAEAEAFLRAELRCGAVKVPPLVLKAKALWITAYYLRRARIKLGVRTVNRGTVGEPEWMWEPPAGGIPPR